MGKNNSKPETGDERVKYYHSKYVTYSRAIAVMWAVLVLCFLIIALVCLIQPTWLGTQRDAPGQGYFGLWRYYINEDNLIIERGKFLDLADIPSASFQAATIFVGLTVLLTIICVFCFFLFMCVSHKIVFIICGWILVFNALFMFLACVIYPGGWSADVVQQLCQSDSYVSGKCYIQWTYYLAIISIFDAIVLAILAFVLAYRQVKLLPWQSSDKLAKKAYIIDDDQASGVQYVQRVHPNHAVQPVYVVDQASAHSHPAATLRSHKSAKQNFNL
ncbi:LHFPL3 [Bugula neritina]|uniref:LHFPL3 n=1 Tax=Bugula neritina TaxID=10212 RepID=A0A7J7J6I8_BUGNE|nr:LHFPL3 [Bugula neritina]